MKFSHQVPHPDIHNDDKEGKDTLSVETSVTEGFECTLKMDAVEIKVLDKPCISFMKCITEP
jgi:hypothetical protein